MYYVYLLRSANFSDQTYIGFTADLKVRLRAHNAGESKHTAKICSLGIGFLSRIF